MFLRIFAYKKLSDVTALALKLFPDRFESCILCSLFFYFITQIIKFPHNECWYIIYFLFIWYSVCRSIPCSSANFNFIKNNSILSSMISFGVSSWVLGNNTIALYHNSVGCFFVKYYYNLLPNNLLDFLGFAQDFCFWLFVKTK